MFLNVKYGDRCLTSIDRLVRCNLPSVTDLFQRTDTRFFCKCLTGVYDFPIIQSDKLHVKHRREGMRGCPVSLYTALPRTDAYRTSLFPRLSNNFSAMSLDMQNEFAKMFVWMPDFVMYTDDAVSFLILSIVIYLYCVLGEYSLVFRRIAFCILPFGNVFCFQ